MRLSLRIWIIVLASLFLASAAACLILAYLQEPKFEDIREGMSRAEVDAVVGKPSSERVSMPGVHSVFVYEGYRQERHVKIVVRFDWDTDLVVSTDSIDEGPDERGFLERIQDRLETWSRMWF